MSSLGKLEKQHIALYSPPVPTQTEHARKHSERTTDQGIVGEDQPTARGVCGGSDVTAMIVF